jgi:hypothetical protein
LSERFKNKFFLTSVIYSILIFTAEITLGNPDFPLTLWTFVSIDGWQWSLPVHTIGLGWIFFVYLKFSGQSIFLLTAVSSGYFILMETLNAVLFHFFIYGKNPLGEYFSFFIVIVLYVVLCGICVFILKRGCRVTSRGDTEDAE